jgi:hypothetical protein
MRPIEQYPLTWNRGAIRKRMKLLAKEWLEQYPLTWNRGAIRKRMKLLANRWLAHDLQKQIIC